jgi:hypothetical protein
MKYKSKFEVVLMLQEKELEEKEMELARFVQKQTEIIRKMEREREQYSLFRAQLEKGAVDAAFFAGSFDSLYQRKLEEELEKIELELKLKRLEYEKMIKKKEKIEEIDKKEEKKFYDEWKKKEQKKIIGMKSIMKLNEKRGEENNEIT